MTNNLWWEDLQIHMVEWRRHLHRNPEVSFHEEKTSSFVADMLESFGIEVKRHIGGHGVIGTLRGEQPGPVVMLRADMDALPIQDEKMWNMLHSNLERCMLAVMMVIYQCCWEPRFISAVIGRKCGEKSVFCFSQQKSCCQVALFRSLPMERWRV